MTNKNRMRYEMSCNQKTCSYDKQKSYDVRITKQKSYDVRVCPYSCGLV